MFILSQDKTRIFNMQGHIEGIGYEEENFKKGKKEEIRHTIQVFDGCAEEIAEYECKEDCLIVLYAIFKAIEQGSKTAELPAREEMKEQREALKQYLESGKKLTEEERFNVMIEINASGMAKCSADIVGAGDYLIRRGWVLLHNPSQGIAIPTRDFSREYTKAQKEFLYDYYMERNCKKEANAIWQEDE